MSVQDYANLGYRLSLLINMGFGISFCRDKDSYIATCYTHKVRVAHGDNEALALAELERRLNESGFLKGVAA